MARNKKVEILSNEQEVLHPMTDGDCVIFEDGQTLTQKLSEDDSVKYTPEIVNSSPMFKVGEGNTVDYSDNVLDGAYERATLQGQTYVNYIQESSADEVTLPTPFTEYERTQHNTLTSDEEGTLGINLVGQSYVNALQHDSEEEYVVLGESLEFQEKKVEYTNEGQIKSAMLKGQTLVNLQKGFKLDGVNTQVSGSFPYTLPADTYIIFYTVEKTCTSTSRPNNARNTMTLKTEDGGTLYQNASPNAHSQTGRFYWKITTTEPIIEVGWWFQNLVTIERPIVKDVVVLEYQEGMENWDIPYFEGMQSVTVSTKLENLCHRHTTSDLAKNGKTFTTNSLTDRCITLVDYKDSAEATYGMKPNTKYLVQFKISNLVLDGLSSLAMAFSVEELGTTNCVFKDGSKIGLITANGVYRVVLTTTDVVSTSGVEIKGFANEWEKSGSTLRSLTISNIMYVEYQNGMENWDLPYFEDYQVMKPVQVESVNKNLQPNGTYSTNTSNNVSSISSDDGLIRIDPTKRYRVSASSTINGCTLRFYDRCKNTITDMNGMYPQIPDNAYYMRLFISIDTNYLNTIQIEESNTSSATEYVPHQSKTTYSWDEVILRKIGDVEDTLDLTTGEWVQRIGEIVLDGSSDEVWQQIKLDMWATTNGVQDSFGYIYYFQHNHKAVDYIVFHEQQSDLYTLCDKLPVCSRKDSVLSVKTNVCTTGGATPSAIQNNTINSYIGIKLDTTKATTLDEFKTWLKQNPLKVHVVMNKPIIRKVNLSRPNLQTYDDITHVHTKCLDGTLIPNIYLPSDISYPAILEPGKAYNVSVNHTEVSADNPLTVNVGGTEIAMTDSRMKLTTPTTLANSNVSFTGKGNKIKESMLIKNSSLLTRDLPHFNGIGSVQLGKTIENLCSSKHERVGSGGSTQSETDDSITITVTKQGSVVCCFELTTLLENGKKYFVYCPSSITTTITSKILMGFKRTYNGVTDYLRQPAGTSITQYIIDQVDNQYTHLTVGCHGNLNIGDVYTIQRPIICEYEQGMEDWDWESIGYFTGTKNIGNEFMKVQNKNLIDKSKIVKGVTYNHGGFSTTSEFGGRLTLRQKDAIPVKLNSVYTVSISPSDFTMGYYLLDEDKNIVYDSGWTPNPVSFLIDRPNAKYLIFNLKKQSGEEIEVSDVTSIQLEESSTATTYTAHKHNGLYITKDQPIDLTWEQGQVLIDTYGSTYTSTINNSLTTRVRNKGLLNLKPNATYRVSLGDKTNFKYHIACFDNWDCSVKEITGIGSGWVSSVDTIFTTTEDIHKIGINVAKIGDGTITPSEINHIRLEEVTDVVLRSCSGKYDELDLTRGTYTQNVGMIYVDGVNQHSNYITVVGDTYQPTDTTLKTFDIRCDGAVVDGICLSNRFPMRESMTSTAINFESVRIHSTNTSCRLTIKKEKASTLEEFKLWLQDNPLEIVYSLKTPIVHKVHIGNKNETNTEVTKPNGVFTLPTLYTEQTHISLTNNGIIPKVQSRDYIAYPVSPMINRTYTLQHNLTGGVSNLTVDLLGRTQEITYQEPKSLIYSPTTMDAILHNELRISGKGKISRVMYIDGGYMDRDIPYIEGMKNAVNPIVKNVGKNLVQKIDNIWYFYDNIINQGGASHNCGIAPVKPYTQYIVNKNSILCFYDENGKCTNSPFQYFSANSPRTAPSGSKYMLVRHNGGDNATYLDGLQVVEYGQEFDNQEYKENICYVDCGEIRLTPDMFEQGSIYSVQGHVGLHYNDDKVDGSARIRTKGLIDLEPGEQYVFLGDPTYLYSMHFYDKNGIKVGVASPYDLSWKGNVPFTIRTDAPKAAIFICKANQSNITPSELEGINFQLVKVSEIKQLRSLPNGVYDEIDLETGTYIQRVGEITFNGTENWIVGYSSWDNKYTYYNNDFVDLKTMKGDNGSGNAYYDAVRCPQLHRSYMSRLASALIDGVCSYYYSGYQRIFISKQDCATVDELKLWLQENPITVQYELPEPIVKDIVIHNYPHSYEDGHVIVENGDPNTPIPAQLTYRAVTNRSGQIQQHTEQVEKQEREINELETLILANIHLSQTR